MYCRTQIPLVIRIYQRMFTKVIRTKLQSPMVLDSEWVLCKDHQFMKVELKSIKDFIEWGVRVY
jgi:hypothetical protein